MNDTKLTVWRKRVVMWTGVIALVEPSVIKYVSPIALTIWVALFLIDVLFNTELTFEERK